MNPEGNVYNAQGRINRLSVLCIDAYGVAVKNGFEGTVEEWLASLKGEDGFSPIATVEQTEAGAFISITDKNGTTTATITNGKDGKDGADGQPGKDGADGAPGAKGDKGDKGDTGEKGEQGIQGEAGHAGADGKSAYAYAQDGGYTGTEEEFAAKLAEDTRPFVITISYDSTNGYTADKTGAEIIDAYEAGRTMICNTFNGSANEFSPCYLVDKMVSNDIWFRFSSTIDSIKNYTFYEIQIDSITNAIKKITCESYKVPVLSNDTLPFVIITDAEGDPTEEGATPITSNIGVAEILEQIQIGQDVFAVYNDTILYPISASPEAVTFYTTQVITQGAAGLTVTVKADKTGEAFITFCFAMPNPNALTINGTTYDGSEAVEVKSTFTVTLTDNIALDKTFDEILTAYQSGYTVQLHHSGQLDGIVFQLYMATDVFIIFTANSVGAIHSVVIMNDGTIDIQVASIPDEYTHPSSHPASMITGLATVATSGKYSDLSGTPSIPTVPSALKSPYALTVGETTYDGSAAVDMTEAVNALIDSRNAPETDLVLSDNLFDKSTAVTGSIFYHSSSGPSLTTASGGFYAYVPLRGAGTYCAFLNWINHGSSYATRVPILKEDKSFLQNVTGTITDIDGSYGYLKFTVTESMIENGAALYAFDGSTTTLDSAMIVKDREYPSEYIPYGYIEVEVEGGSEVSANNVLSGKTAVFLGDSICAGTTVGDNSEYYGYGWAGLIGERNAMIWKNYGRNGGTITPLSSVDTARWVPTQADSAFAAYPNADYVIFEGGCNDADTMQDALLGEISSDYATFDETTFSGAFESLVLKLLSKFPTAKIGYVIPQKMNAVNDHSAAGHVHRRFFDRAIEICEKWGIPCIDLWKCNPLNPKLSTASRFYTDGQHLTLEGYQRITPQIEAFMRSL